LLDKFRNQIIDQKNKDNLNTLKQFYQTGNKLALDEKDRAEKMQTMKTDRLIRIILIVLILVIIYAAVLLFYNYRQRQTIKLVEKEQALQQLKNKQELEKLQASLEATNAERNRIAKELHDDLGSSISSIHIFSELALKEFDQNKEKSKDLLLRINNRGQEIAAHISDIIWSMYAVDDSMAELFKHVQQFAFEFLAPQNIRLAIHAEEPIKSISLKAEQRKNLYLIIKEALNNAAKYSGCSVIDLTVYEKDGAHYLNITDNGKGFDMDKTKGNNGFVTMKQRAEAIGGNLQIISAPEEGTTILLSLFLI
jgi:signal transduction histidine kinase